MGKKINPQNYTNCARPAMCMMAQQSPSWESKQESPHHTSPGAGSPWPKTTRENVTARPRTALGLWGPTRQPEQSDSKAHTGTLLPALSYIQENIWGHWETLSDLCVGRPETCFRCFSFPMNKEKCPQVWHGSGGLSDLSDLESLCAHN